MCSEFLGVDYDSVTRGHRDLTAQYGFFRLSDGHRSDRGHPRGLHATKHGTLRLAAWVLEYRGPGRARHCRTGRCGIAATPGVCRHPREPCSRWPSGQGLPPGVAGLEDNGSLRPARGGVLVGTAAAVVSVDSETGDFDVEQFVMVHDCGTPVNPKLIDGQVRGGLVQGLGAALAEELRYDPETAGQLGERLDVESLRTVGLNVRRSRCCIPRSRHRSLSSAQVGAIPGAACRQRHLW